MSTHSKESSSDPKANLQKLASLIRSIRVAMMTTWAADGELHTRPMYAVGVDEDSFAGEIWFMSQAGSGQNEQLEANPKIMLTFSHPGQNNYAVVQGTGVVTRNEAKARELWNVHAKGWFPEGPEDPNLTLIRVQTRTAEYWEGPSSTAYFLSLFKAVVADEQMDPGGDHGEVKLS